MVELELQGIWFQETGEPRKKKNLVLSMESWLFNRDPCNGLL